MQSCITHLDNVFGCQVNVSIMADNTGILAAQLHLDGNHASLHHHTLLAHFGRACVRAFVHACVHLCARACVRVETKVLDQHFLHLFHVWNSVRCRKN